MTPSKVVAKQRIMAAFGASRQAEHIFRNLLPAHGMAVREGQIVVLNMKLSRWGLLTQAKQSRLGCFGKSRGLGEIRHQDFAELLLLE